jgi:hypothetical protein
MVDPCLNMVKKKKKKKKKKVNLKKNQFLVTNLPFYLFILHSINHKDSSNMIATFLNFNKQDEPTNVQ